jgi:hypothetical protein
MEKEIVCNCGKKANCLISRIGWLCKDCFDQILKEQGAILKNQETKV